jgi:hypothetical protein
MADKDGKLSQEEKKVVVQWIARHQSATKNLCPICNSDKWIIGDHLVQPLTLSGDKGIMLGGVGYPQVLLISDPCGYTRFFNAVLMGVAAAAPKEGGS